MLNSASRALQIGTTNSAAGGDARAGESGSSSAPMWSGGIQGGGVLQGWLRKKSPAAGKGWQARWFVLHGMRLSYFKKENDEIAAGSIDLSLIAACFTTTETKHGGRGIKLMMLDQRTYYLLASNRSDAQFWVQAISDAVHPTGPMGSPPTGSSESVVGSEEVDVDVDDEDNEIDDESEDERARQINDVSSSSDEEQAQDGEQRGSTVGGARMTAEMDEAALLEEAKALETANAALQTEVKELEAALELL